MRLVRSMLAVFVVLALSFSSAPAAQAATIETTLTGQVIGYSGVANIDLYQWTGSSFDPLPNRDDQTAADGSFSITVGLTVGDTYTVRASAVTFGSRYYGGATTKPTTAAAGFVAGASTIDLGTFSLGTTYTLSGAVLDENGAGFAGATVKVFAASADPATDAPLFTGESGDDGGYGFNQLPADSYLVVASAPGYVSASTTKTITVASVSVNDLSLALGQSSISGVVTLPDGAAAAGATVQVYRWVDGDWAADRTLTTGSDGGYQFSVTTKSALALFAKATGYIGAWSGGVSAQPADSTSSGVITAAEGFAVPLQLSTGFGAVAGQSLSYCTAQTLSAEGTYNEAKVPLDFAVGLYGSAHQNLFVTDRGVVYLADSSHQGEFLGSDPSALDTWTGVPVIAPLWFDGDTSGAVPGSVTYGSSSDGKSFCVRWNNLGHYGPIEDNPNTFQLILQSKTGAAGRSSGDVDITFNYDQVLWDGSNSRAVGYSAGDAADGHFWVYDGSSNPGVITDSGSSPLVTHSVGSSTAGRYFFEIKNALINTAKPSISGPAIPGGTLTADAGSWSPTASSFSYQWLLGNAEVAGATSSTWTVPPDTAAGGSVTVRVTATAVGLSSVSADSVARLVSRFDALQTPAISGSAIAGGTLTVGAGSWSLSPDGVVRQWFLDGKPIANATSEKFRVPAKIEGRAISATVTAHKDGYSDVTASAAAVKVLRVFSKKPTPTISGTAKVGKTLTAKPGTWSPKPGLRYEWFRSGVAISGAKASKYKVQLADVGKKLTVRVTAAKADYLSASKTSRATKTVPAVPLKASTPKILGTAKVGQTLRVSRGSWTSGATLVIRWYRSGKLVAGATDAAYLLQPTDKGKTFTVKITGSKAGYTTATKTSKATKKIA